METLPVEMVLKISNQLTPEDLARCCRVSRQWREIFNHDWLWKPHSDPALEEHLRTTPSVVEPMFVTPERRNSMLTPVSQWRLAFMREKHLYNNWKHNNYKAESLCELNNEVHRHFFTNTHILRWCSTYIEVWDVSVVPAVFVTKTDPSVVDMTGWVSGLFEGSWIVVQQFTSVKVLSVDVNNKCITLKHNILKDIENEPLDSAYWRHSYSCINQQLCWRNCTIKGLDCVKGSTFVHVNENWTSLDIFNLETGKKVKVEACPMINGNHKRPKISGLTTSPTSDLVVVIVSLKIEDSNSNCDSGFDFLNSNDYFYYIYNPKKLCFLPGPVVSKRASSYPDYGQIFRHYFAISENDDTFTVYDCHSQENVLRIPPSRGLEGLSFYSCGPSDYFVFKHRHFLSVKLKMFSFSSLTWVILPELYQSNVPDIKVLNNKLIAVLSHDLDWYFLSGNVWVKSDFSFDYQPEINQMSTTIISKCTSSFRAKLTHVTRQCSGKGTRKGNLDINHYW